MRTPKRLSVAAIVTCVALLGGALIGSSADAKKKKKHKRGGGTVTAVRSTPTAIPVAVAPKASQVVVPLTIGKKAKGKIVGDAGPSVTYGLSGDKGQLGAIVVRVTAPNGRTTSLWNPAGSEDSAVGPMTSTANSTVVTCTTDPDGPTPPCADPDATLLAPYAGTVGDTGLAWFSGIRATGTWTLRVFNFSTTHAATLTTAGISIPAVSKRAN